MARSRARSPVAPLRDVASILAAFESLASPRIRQEMLPRYGIPTETAHGVSMANLKALAKRCGENHALAAELWAEGSYEARMLAAMIDEPERVTAAQMERWCKDFDNWGICDTTCFVLFDRAAPAWEKVKAWARRRPEFEKRAAFALLWSLALHDRAAPDASFVDALSLVEAAATDERHYVHKAVDMALRAVGQRTRGLHAAALALANRLAASEVAAARSLGKHVLRELASPKVERRLRAREARR